jgi:hypothetical protein
MHIVFYVDLTKTYYPRMLKVEPKVLGPTNVDSDYMVSSFIDKFVYQ